MQISSTMSVETTDIKGLIWVGWMRKSVKTFLSGLWVFCRDEFSLCSLFSEGVCDKSVNIEICDGCSLHLESQDHKFAEWDQFHHVLKWNKLFNYNTHLGSGMIEELSTRLN